MVDWDTLVEDVLSKDASWEDDQRQVAELVAAADLDEGEASGLRLEAFIRDKTWSRRKAYALFLGALVREVDERRTEFLEDFLDGLVGWCAPGCVMRFDGDPEDQNEVARYARGSAWEHEDRYGEG